jgi:hypothetical protein
VLTLRRLTCWRLNTVRRGITTPGRYVWSDGSAMFIRLFKRSMRRGCAKPAIVCVSCRGSGLRFPRWWVAETERRWSCNGSRRSFPTRLVLVNSCIVERTQPSAGVEGGGVVCGPRRRGRVRSYLLDRGLGAIPGDIVDEPLARARLARTARPVITRGIAGLRRGGWKRRSALRSRGPFLRDPGAFADEQQECNAGHGQDARAATGPNSLPARCELSEGDGSLNHGHHPVQDGQAQGSRSNWLQRNATMNVFK